MSKKKKKKAAPKPTPAVTPKILDALKAFADSAAERQANRPNLVQTLTAPPENIAEHLKRIGAEHLPRIMDVMFGDEPTECLVIPWSALQMAEYEYLASGQWKGK